MNIEIKNIFDKYPQRIRDSLLQLRRLILDVAAQESNAEVEECIKWGQVSYVSKTGSTIRIDSTGKKTDQYALYFHCQTRLVETFREIYAADLKFDGKRAILYDCSADIPLEATKHCVSMALRYHSIKHLPLLGA